MSTRSDLAAVRSALDACGSIEEFAKNLDLEFCFDSSRSSAVITYRGWDPSHFALAVRSNLKSDQETATELRKTCRGLIFEPKAPWKCLSRAFDRFDRVTASTPEFLDGFRSVYTTVKEDGSLMSLFRSNSEPGKWQLATLSDFADDPLPATGKTYAETFLETLQTVYGIESLANLASMIEESIGCEFLTACFEMCTSANRVIRRYETPTIILIGVFSGMDGTVSHPIHAINFQPRPGYHPLPTITKVPNVVTFQDAVQYIKSVVPTDPTFEGLVLISAKGERLKVKSSFYLDLHGLKFRGLIRSTLDLWIPYFLDNMDEILYKALVDVVGQSDAAGMLEIDESRKRYRTIYEMHLKRVKACVDLSLETAALRDPIIFLIHSSLLEQLRDNPSASFDDLWRTHVLSPRVQAQMYKAEEFEEESGFLPFDLMNVDIASLDKGIGPDGNSCACGKPVSCVRLKRDLILTSVANPLKVLKINRTGTEIMQCVDPKCGLTHEAIGRVSIGLPGSALCRELRVRIQQKLREMKTEETKSQAYSDIRKALFGDDDEKHQFKLSLLSVPQCVSVLRAITKPTFALVFLVDNPLIKEKIQCFRRDMDPEYAQLPPHIKLCFPYVADNLFTADKDEIATRIKSAEKIQIQLNSLEIFAPSRMIVISPERAQMQQLKQVVERLVDTKKDRRGFYPFITIGRGIGSDSLYELSKKWEPTSLEFTRLVCLVRYGDEPFREHWSIPLSEASPGTTI